MIELDCAVKHDEWGKLGSSSFVGQLLKSQRRKISESKPYTELWMGTHQSGPSRVTNLSPDFDNKPIDSVLKAWPEFVGNLDITHKYGQNLPILVKILSINRPSPLQVISPSDYDSSKIVIGLTSTSILCGFKDHEKILNDLEGSTIRGSILRMLISPMTISEYTQSVLNTDKECDKLLGRCFNEALDSCQSQKLISSSVLLQTIIKSDDESDETINLINNLLDKDLTIYGLVALSFLNLVHLNPDQALIISTNQVHTYLNGNCLEVSNPNDKTIQLESSSRVPIFDSILPETPKFIDPVCIDQTSHRYHHDSSNLMVELINANNDNDLNIFISNYQAQSTQSGSFVLVLGLTQTIVNNVYRIKPGQIFFVPPGLPLRFSHIRGEFKLFRVSLKP